MSIIETWIVFNFNFNNLHTLKLQNSITHIRYRLLNITYCFAFQRRPPSGIFIFPDHRLPPSWHAVTFMSSSHLLILFLFSFLLLSIYPSINNKINLGTFLRFDFDIICHMMEQIISTYIKFLNYVYRVKINLPIRIKMINGIIK